MTFTEWFIFFLIIQVIHFLGTWKLYVKAVRKPWEALMPIYNAVVLMQIIKRPKWWVILLFIPVVNLLMFPIIWIETCRSFGFKKRIHTILAIVTLGFYIFYINYFTDAEHRKDRSIEPQSNLGEWVSSISFAVIAATLVHTYIMQPFTIPSSSLEKTLLVGDYLFVSKFHYGARVPMTTVAAPMVHDTLPFIGKSYLSDDKSKNGLLNKLSLPYMRLPGIQKIKRNEIVCFTWPADTLATMWGDNSGKTTYKPIDKRTNYVKRAVGIAGDSLEVRNGYVFINGKRTDLPDRAKPQWFFDVDTGGKQFSQAAFKRYNIKEGRNTQNGYILNLTDNEAAKMAKNPIVKNITKRINTNEGYDKSVFPHDPQYKWNSDNFGPIYIPKKGATVKLDSKSIPFYKQVIGRYEGNNLVVMNDDIYINGKKAESYTFKQDYYWLMGDNRQNSLDARNWGYVPFDHVLGKPVMIWLSWDPDISIFDFSKKIKSMRWDRMFTTVHGSGKSNSFLFPIIILLIAYFGFDSWWKKNKKIEINENETKEKKLYASVPDRIQAAIIDSFFIMGLIYFTSQIFTLVNGVSDTMKIITFVFIFILYDPLLTSFNGGTIGHSLSKISVKKENDINKNISFPLALIRFILKVLLGWISLTTITGNKKRKAIHDFIAKSVVIRNK